MPHFQGSRGNSSLGWHLPSFPHFHAVCCILSFWILRNAITPLSYCHLSPLLLGFPELPLGSCLFLLSLPCQANHVVGIAGAILASGTPLYKVHEWKTMGDLLKSDSGGLLPTPGTQLSTEVAAWVPQGAGRLSLWEISQQRPLHLLGHLKFTW